MEQSPEKNKKSKNIKLYAVGWIVLIVGITLNLLWWDDFMLLLRGMAGIVISFSGLLILYTMGRKL